MLSPFAAWFLGLVALYLFLAEPQKKKRLTPAEKKAKALEQENKDLRLQLGMPPGRRRGPDPQPTERPSGGSVTPVMMIAAVMGAAAIQAKAKAKAKETQDETATELSN